MRQNLTLYMLIILSLVPGPRAVVLASTPTVTVVDVPGAVGTEVFAISNTGQIVGWFVDAARRPYGFLRSPEGAITTFAPPDPFNIISNLAINDTGQVVGGLCGDATCVSNWHGLLRSPDGTITTLDVPGATDTVAVAINNAGQIVGLFTAFGVGLHGFLRSPEGTFTTFDVPGAYETGARAINNAGQIVGFFDHDLRGARHGFLRSPEGTFTTFDPPGAFYTDVSAINDAGHIVGRFYDAGGSHGFLRSPEGTFTTFDPPGAFYTEVSAINDAGHIVGRFYDAGGYHGFLRSPDGTITTLDPPGSVDTYVFAINNAGQIAGFFGSATGLHGFVATSVTVPITLVDPVPDPTACPHPCLLVGSGITVDADKLATLGRQVNGVAADGVTRIVVRIPATSGGETFDLTVMRDAQTPSISTDRDGGVRPIGAPESSSSTTTTVTAAMAAGNPMAFAIYQAPMDFPDGVVSWDAATRAVMLQIKRGGSVIGSVMIEIHRPPVVLIHGVWDSSDGWNDLTFDENVFFIGRADYGRKKITYSFTDPPLDPPAEHFQISTNSLGFRFNAAFVLPQIEAFIDEFRILANIAVTQADVVAHSMGGVVARALPSLHSFRKPTNYDQGTVHKLITIGTPHQGTNVADAMLQDNNSCVRYWFAKKGHPAFAVAFTPASTFALNGAVGDLRFGIAASTFQQPGRRSLSTALVVGQMLPQQLDAIDSVVLGIHSLCAPLLNPLAADFTSASWPSVLGGESDALVPVWSQMNLLQAPPQSPPGVTTLYGVVHSAGMVTLGFAGPHELEDAGGAQAVVRILLNTPVTDSQKFTLLP